MTHEEAIHALDTLVEAYGVAIRAIRAQINVKGVEIDTVKSAKLDRSQWNGCGWCKRFQGKFDETKEDLYCRFCGRPLTEESWAELERRINDGTAD